MATTSSSTPNVIAAAMPGSVPASAGAPSGAPVSLPATYEEALSELDALVAGMEGGKLALDALLTGYKRGAELLAYCRGKLEAVEQQVKVLEDGQLKAWPHT